MKRLLVVFVLLAAGVVGLGFYLGWFHFTTGGTDANPSATITVDQDKIKADKEKAAEKVQDLGEKAKDKASAAADKGKEETRKP